MLRVDDNSELVDGRDAVAEMLEVVFLISRALSWSCKLRSTRSELKSEFVLLNIGVCADEARSLTLLRGGNELRFDVPGVVGFRGRLIFKGSGIIAGSGICRRFIGRVARGGSGSYGGGPEAENNLLADAFGLKMLRLPLELSAVCGRTAVGLGSGC